MIEVTIIRLATGEWSSVSIARNVALIVSGNLTTDTDTDTAWQLVSYAAARPSDFQVVYQEA